MSLNSPLELACGAVLNNRLAKAAMTERLSGPDYQANSQHIALYKQWAENNAGLMITGNIMVDRRYMESAGNIALDNHDGIDRLKKLTAVGTKYHQHFWAQINHAGRQTHRFMSHQPIAPSAVQLKKMMLFARPRAMTELDILDVRDRFISTALRCKEAGFTGVQFHAAHGYLLSQFLSPITNQRSDQWGGSLENRSRLLRSIIKKSRELLGADYPISIKVNSADFQRGGFSQEEALEFIYGLEESSLDLIEISGGTYEQVAFFDLSEQAMRDSTRQREAYFLDFARQVKQISSIPLMVTGGFRTYQFCTEALDSGSVDVIGMARPFLLEPQRLGDFLEGKLERLADHTLRTTIPMLDDAAVGGFYAKQLHLLARGKSPKVNYSPLKAVLYFIAIEMTKGLRKQMLRKR